MTHYKCDGVPSCLKDPKTRIENMEPAEKMGLQDIVESTFQPIVLSLDELLHKVLQRLSQLYLQLI